jgi:hypothetical protein
MAGGHQQQTKPGRRAPGTGFLFPALSDPHESDQENPHPSAQFFDCKLQVI